MKKISASILLWISVALIIMLLFFNILAKWDSESTTSSNGNFTIENLAKEPLVLTAIGAILVFLLVDRWRRIEIEISSIRAKQFDVLKNIRDDAENIVKGRLESTTRKAKAIESKIGGLLEEHPWISSITENDLIPDASSCRIVLRTCEQLLMKNRDSLLYEYVYSWFDKKDKEARLRGTADDFMDLVDFCERILGDEYLGYLLLREASSNASNRVYIFPDYLKRLIRHGHYNDAKKIARQIRGVLPIQFKFIGIPYFRSIGMNANFIFKAYCSLALFESLKRNELRINTYFQRAEVISKILAKENSLICTQAEAYTLLGQFEQAEQALEKLSLFKSRKKITESQEDYVYEAARLYRTLGQSQKFIKLISTFGNYEIEREDVDIGLNEDFKRTEKLFVKKDEPKKSRQINPTQISGDVEINEDNIKK